MPCGGFASFARVMPGEFERAGTRAIGPATYPPPPSTTFGSSGVGPLGRSLGFAGVDRVGLDIREFIDHIVEVVLVGDPNGRGVVGGQR